MVGIRLYPNAWVSAKSLLTESSSQVSDAEVRVALEHLQRLMTGYRCDLHHVKSLLEESTGGLMPQVVQPQALDASAVHGALEGLLDSVLSEVAENAAVAGGG